MTTLDKVTQMQQQGMSDSDIAYSLRDEGINPKEISDSLAQAKIKTAVSQPIQEYQESAPSPQQDPTPQQPQYAPQPQYQEQQYAQQPYQDPNQAYSNQTYYPEQPAMSIDTISEVVDRLLLDKLKELNQKMKTLSDFKINAEEDMKDIKERLKNIESSIENLQRSVIGKIGEFGESTEVIHRDLENLHGTVSKLMNPLVDNYNELKKFNAKKI